MTPAAARVLSGYRAPLGSGTRRMNSAIPYPPSRPAAAPTTISSANSPSPLPTACQPLAVPTASRLAIAAMPTGSLAPDSPSTRVPVRPEISRRPSTENTTAGSVGASAVPSSRAGSQPKPNSRCASAATPAVVANVPTTPIHATGPAADRGRGLTAADPAATGGQPLPATTRDRNTAASNNCRMHTTTAPPDVPAGRDDLVDALLSASRAMVGLAARSRADRDAEVTLPQYRALVVLASRGPQRMVDISAELGVNPSTGTRMCDRLVRKGLARRYRTAGDRRAVRLTLTPAGRRLVEEVTTRRRTELARIVADMPDHQRAPVIAALRAFATAAGEVPEQEWWLGWAHSDDDTDPA